MSAPRNPDPAPDRALIPAAGLGTRLRPLSAAIPKEMLPLGRKPVLEYVVEEMRAAGLTRLLFVISPGKELIRGYFGDGSRWGVHCDYVVQSEMRGLGDAILHGESWTEGQPFVVAFGDCIIEMRRDAASRVFASQESKAPPPPSRAIREVEGRHGMFSPSSAPLRLCDSNVAASSPLVRLIRTHVCQGAAATVLTERIAREDTRKYGIVAPAMALTDAPTEPFPLAGTVEKPAPEAAPSLQAVAARWMLRASIFDSLRRVEPGPNGEIGLTEAVHALLGAGAPAWAVPLHDGETRLDIGAWDTYLVAAARAAARDPEWGGRVRAAVRDAEGTE